jgi:hypothetical protein
VTAPQPWDWPPEPKRRPRIEILPPEPHPEAHVRVTIHRRNTMPPWVIAVAIAFGLFILWRFKMAFVMLGALLGAI